MNIHDNPDANAWAEEFAKLFPTSDVGTMLETEHYRISNYPDFPDGRKNILWVENESGEGMGVCLDELWKEKF